VRDRHATYYLRLAEAAAPHLNTQEQQHWLVRLEAARDNLRSALEWYIHRGATDSSLRLVAALWKFWHIRSRHTEGHRWITLVLDASNPGDDDVRAQALHGAGWIALDRSEPAEAEKYFSESLAIFRRTGHAHGVAEALHGVGVCAQARGEHAAAAELFTESLELHRGLGTDEGVAWSLDHIGDAMLNMGDYERAEALLAESLAIFRRLRHTWGSAISLHHQGLTALARRDSALADVRLRDSLALFDTLDNCWGIATSFDHLGYAALQRRDYARAREHFLTALRRNHAEQDRGGFARSVSGLASVAVRQRRPELAARLFGAAGAMADGGGVHMNPVVRPIGDRDAATIRATLGDFATDRAWAAGGEMTMGQLVMLLTTAS
jgi:tetratricopeptide (TPR) repeat protein